jgi:hypothetical protein
MKRQFAVLVLAAALVLSFSAPALAAPTRDTGARDRSFHAFVVKAVKHVRTLLGLTSQDEVDTPIPPRPCVTNCP